MKSCILALDQGTTSSRAILFDASGSIRGIAQREFRQHYPQPGWVEHDAEEIWHSQLGVAREVLQKNALTADDIAAIGITNQRETTVLWERSTGRPLAPAIVWQDRRTADICDELRNAGHAALFQQKTGLLLDAYFSGTKLKWLLDKIPGARERARRGELAFGTIDTWLLWQLTGGRCHLTDVSNASRTLLYNLHDKCWDEELLALLDIPRELLPAVRGNSEIYGMTEAHWLGAAIPLAGSAGDQQAATFGQVCLSPGMAKNTYGTGCFMLLNTGKQPMASRHQLLTTVAWQLGDRSDSTEYALEGSVFMGGATVQWLRDGLGIIRQSDEIEALAASVPDNGGVYLVPAFTGLGAPHWQPHARASLFGMSRGTTRAHIARAALEAIAYQSADVLTAMQNDAGLRLRELRVDGGAARNDLLMQFQADLLDVAVVRPHITETTALGAAYLAGLAVGFWQSADELSALWRSERRFEPAMPPSLRASLLDHWRAAVAQTIAWQRQTGG
ncbi:glycerol kinase [Sterolibacterium denitrificans]|uniref:Glycerol kinase n=1 Tax=Sterolibacterium denitrificans TaxID=157592 RepID=A0A7Z7MVP7_9PROT|nr:glycerol kinase GlpK [Sterolibacterium denitrificans]SMB28390.1 glycerol kinase [Sterolibacterium denitrificans]